MAKTKPFHMPRLLASDSAEPQWCMLFPKGTWARRDFPGGKFTFTSDWLEKVKANWEKHGSQPLPVDYNHEEEDIASGWIEELDVRDDGLWGLVKWTDSARAHIKADEYRYLSPSWAFDSKDRNSGTEQGPWLYGAGLLNDPFFDAMPRVAASRPPSPTPTEESNMNKKLVCQLLAGMGYAVNDNDADDVVNAALEKATTAKAWNVGDDKVKAAVEPLKGALAEAQKQLASSIEENKKLAASVDELKAAKLAAEHDALVKALVDGNHIVAAQGDAVKAYAKAMGTEEAKKFFSAFKAHALTTEQGHSGNPAGDESPEGAHKKLEADIAALAAKENITHSAARERIYAMAANRKLVDAATKLVGTERPN